VKWVSGATGLFAPDRSVDLPLAAGRYDELRLLNTGYQGGSLAVTLRYDSGEDEEVAVPIPRWNSAGSGISVRYNRDGESTSPTSGFLRFKGASGTADVGLFAAALPVDNTRLLTEVTMTTQSVDNTALLLSACNPAGSPTTTKPMTAAPAPNAPLPVILVHGFMSSPAEMRSLGDRLHTAGCHVVGVRLRGHGTSPWDLRGRNWHEWAESVTRGYHIAKAFSRSVHLVGFSTGGLLALQHAANNPTIRIKSVTSVCAPLHFINKNMVFVPLVHHANKLVSWVNSEGIMPFIPNQPENPEVNYQHIPVRALYQLQRLINHLSEDALTINADVHLYQADQDPVVDPSSLQAIDKLIVAEHKTLNTLASDSHGVIYRNIDEAQQKICASILESV
jgi:esterase/lipase